MQLRRVAPLAVLVALVVTSQAVADEKKWREQKKVYDEALAAIEGDRGVDLKKLGEAITTLRGAAAAMMAENQQKTVEHLVANGLGGKRAASEEALNALATQVTEPKAARDLQKAFEDAAGKQKLLLAEALRGQASEEVTMAFVKAMRDKDADVRAVAARALGSRGAAAKEAAQAPLQKALKDESLRVRWTAARALEQLGVERPKGFEDRPAAPSGLPSSFEDDRVAFLVDVSMSAGETDFADPFAPPAPVVSATPTGKPDKKGEKPAAPAGPAATSPHAIAAAAVKAAVGALGDTTAQVVRVGATGGSRSWREGYTRFQAKDLDDVATFVERSPSDRGRDLLAPLQRLLEADVLPHHIYVFLVGLPEGRGAGSASDTVARVKELVWGRDVTIDVVAFESQPATLPTDERGRVALNEAQGNYGKFVDELAQAGRGRASRVTLTRVEPVKPVGNGGGEAPPAPPAKPALSLDLTKAVPTRDVDKVRTAMRDATDKGDDASEKLLEDVAACPDKKLAALVLDGLRQASDKDGKRAAGEALVRGMNKNADPGAVGELLDALKSVEKTNVAYQLLLVRAVGKSPAPVTSGLLDALGSERLSVDAQRLAWMYLAQRPAAELKDQAGRLVQRAGKLNGGLTDFHAKTALAIANGTPPPTPAGLEAKDGAFLPERFVASGVAIIIDDQREMDAVFYTPPPPPAPPKPTTEKAPRRGGKETEAAPPPPPPVSRLGAAQLEARRALKALAQGGAKANVILTSGRSWKSSVEPLEKQGLAGAERFVDDIRAGPSRDVLKALQQALGDPAVEVVHLLLCGTPVRSPGATDPAELRRLVQSLQRERAVTIQLVYVLGPVGSAAAEVAARKDLLTQLDTTYRAIAEESGGRVQVRETLLTLAAPAAPGAPGAAPGGGAPPAPPATETPPSTPPGVGAGG
jgi:hypothetical protein